MTATYVDVGCPPIPPPSIPPIAPRAPRPLGLWRALAWFALAVIAAFAVAFAYAIIVGWIANPARLGQPVTVRIGQDLQGCAVQAAMLAALLLVLVIACRRSGWRAIDYLALTRPRGAFLRVAVTAFILTWAMVLGAAWFGDLQRATDTPKSISDLAALLIAVTVLASVGEELIFRGFLFRALAESRLGVVGAIVLTALVWASLHVDKSWLGTAVVFVAGLGWGWVRWRTQSTLTTIAIHSLFNLLGNVGIAAAALGAGS